MSTSIISTEETKQIQSSMVKYFIGYVDNKYNINIHENKYFANIMTLFPTYGNRIFHDLVDLFSIYQNLSIQYILKDFGDYIHKYF